MAKVLVKDGYITTDKQISSLANIAYQKESCMERVRELQEELNMLAIADPKMLCDKDEDPIYTIRQRVSDIMESIRAELSDYNELDLLDDLINEWNDTCIWDGKIFFSPSVDTSKYDGFEVVVVKENDYGQTAKSGANAFTSKDYTKLTDYYADCVTDLDAHTKNTHVTGQWAIYKGNDLLVRKDGGFLFTDVVSAEHWLENAFNFEITNFISHHYLHEHPAFKQEMLNAAHDKYTDDVFKEIEDYFNADKADYKQMERVANYMKKLFLDYLVTQNNIVIKNIMIMPCIPQD